MIDPTLKSVKVSSKGQVTLPKKLLLKMGLGYGDFVNISGDEEGLHISPLKNNVDNILDKLHCRIKIPPNLKGQDLDQAIALAKTAQYVRSSAFKKGASS